MIIGYELGITSAANPAATSNYCEFRGNGTRRVKMREVGVSSRVATAVTFQLARPAAIGVTPTAPITWTPQDPADAAGTGQTAIAWTTPPTAPTNASGILRQWEFNNVVGSAVIWTWPSDGELIVPATGTTSIVIWAVTAGPTASIYFVGSE